MNVIQIISAYTKIDVPYLVTFFITTPTFEWYVISYGIKNGYQNHMYLKDMYLKYNYHSRPNQSTYLVQGREGGPI